MINFKSKIIELTPLGMEENKLGCYYVLIFYPSKIYLEPKRAIWIYQDDKIASVVALSPIDTVMIRDYRNSILTQKVDGKMRTKLANETYHISNKNVTLFLEGKSHIVIDYEKHYHQEFHNSENTELLISFETTADADNLSFAQLVLDRFIRDYKVLSDDHFTPYTNEVNIPLILVKEAYVLYTSEDLAIQGVKDRMTVPRDLAFGIKQMKIPPYLRLKTNQNSLKNTTLLNQFYSRKEEWHPSALYIYNAKESLEKYGNYKFSFIESWTAIETTIVQLITKEKLARGISKNKIEELESEVGISYLLNIEMYLVFTKTDELTKLINDANGLRKIRNKVVHTNSPISKEQADKALNTAIDVMKYFKVPFYLEKG